VEFIRNYFFIVLLIALSGPVFGQSGIKGIVRDGSTLIPSASISVVGADNITAVSAADGSYTLTLSPGIYAVEVSSVNFQRKQKDSVVVAANNFTVLNFDLKAKKNALGEIKAKGGAKKETINSLLVQQRTSAVIMDAISAESIKQLPARNTADVVKRIGGVTIADNKFIIVRGLSDRYNAPYLNGAALPSTDAERRAFAFDILPSSALDNIMIIKSATPDVPADFAGGTVLLSTKETNKTNSTSIQVGTNINSLATFQPYFGTTSGKLDAFGMDGGARSLPKAFPADVASFNALTFDQRKALSTSLAPSYKYTFDKTRLPGIQLLVNNNHKLFDKNTRSLTMYTAVSYNRAFRKEHFAREDQDNDKSISFKYDDVADRDLVLLGGIINFNLALGDKNRISFKNFVSQNSDNTNMYRTGIRPSEDFQQKIYTNTFTSSTLTSSQLGGQHTLPGKRALKIEWMAGYGSITRLVPDLRSTTYNRTYSDTLNSYYSVGMNQFPNILIAGRFYSKLVEQLPSARLDFSVPFTKSDLPQKFKVGVNYQSRMRTFNARRFGYVINPFALTDLPQKSPDSLFDVTNIGKAGLVIGEATQPSDSYTGNSTVLGTYAMMDNSFAKRLKIAWGARVENWNLLLHSNDGLVDRDYTRSNFSILPSAVATYIVDDKANFRVSASRTVSRPEFREIAPFAFFDFNSNSLLVGYDSLQQSGITNLDLRYELFPASGEMLSASVFYKSFDAPIEQRFFSTGAGSQTRSYKNYSQGIVYGMEAEFRKSLGFMKAGKEKGIWNNTSVFGNLALMKSAVDYEVAGITYTRAMQGQSRYIVNLGANYSSKKNGLGASVVYNRIGERIIMVGDNTEATLWEKPRDLLDVVVTKSFKNNMEIRLAIADLLAQNLIMYQNDAAGTQTRYSETASSIFIKNTMGSNTSLSFLYKIK
jgi:TonB-dependent receptor